jgi:hypothetical protein
MHWHCALWTTPNALGSAKPARHVDKVIDFGTWGDRKARGSCCQGACFFDCVSHICSDSQHVLQSGTDTCTDRKNVQLVQGDLADCHRLFKDIEPVCGVFSVQVNGKDEETQGKALIDAAIANSVKHFVYASVDRGGLKKSDEKSD